MFVVGSGLYSSSQHIVFILIILRYDILTSRRRSSCLMPFRCLNDIFPSLLITHGVILEPSLVKSAAKLIMQQIPLRMASTVTRTYADSILLLRRSKSIGFAYHNCIPRLSR